MTKTTPTIAVTGSGRSAFIAQALAALSGHAVVMPPADMNETSPVSLSENLSRQQRRWFQRKGTALKVT